MERELTAEEAIERVDGTKAVHERELVVSALRQLFDERDKLQIRSAELESSRDSLLDAVDDYRKMCAEVKANLLTLAGEYEKLREELDSIKDITKNKWVDGFKRLQEG